MIFSKKIKFLNYKVKIFVFSEKLKFKILSEKFDILKKK